MNWYIYRLGLPSVVAIANSREEALEWCRKYIAMWAGMGVKVKYKIHYNQTPGEGEVVE